MRKLFAVVLAAWTTAGMAQVPTGQFSYAFTNTPIWDLTGSYTNENLTDIHIEVLNESPQGSLSGAFSDTFLNGGILGIGLGTGEGKVSGPAGDVWIKALWSEGLRGTDNGVDFIGTNVGETLGTVNQATLQLYALKRDRLCVVGVGCEVNTVAVQPALPPGMDGSWTLQIDIVPNGKKLGGTATITLSNGRMLAYSLTGSYNEKSQTASIKLVGQGDALKTAFTMRTVGSTMGLVSIKGGVMGEKLRYP